ncbi:MAG: YqgE/AlgH family protein [Pseudomonadota bacterium]|nr:MAG: YqgE/AlgH family protein [Pseudomonadota bacterium]
MTAGSRPKTAAALTTAGLMLCAALLVLTSDPRAQTEPPRSERIVAGDFLVATPDLTDPNFYHSVVFIAGHDDDGTIGVIINRETRFNLGEVLEENGTLRGSADKVYWGGPVRQHSLVFLFSAADKPDDAMHVMDDLYLSGNLEVLERLVGAERRGGELRIYAGLASWAPGQLQAELEHGAWNVLPADRTLIFEDDHSKTWMDLMRTASGHWVRHKPDERLPVPLRLHPG